jgi:hypothetical protein
LPNGRFVAFLGIRQKVSAHLAFREGLVQKGISWHKLIEQF